MKRTTSRLLYTASVLAAIAQVGCGPEDIDSETTPARRESELGAPPVIPGLNTYITGSIQIDQLGTGLSPEDANVFVGVDPADKTASVNKPTGGPGNFIDWDDFSSAPDLANHRIQDLNIATGEDLGLDPTSFPHSNECVGKSNVLKKMDLTYVAAANNKVWAYLAVQRSANSGDAGYYWLFTKLSPQMRHEELPCEPGETRLLYDISVGDVLLAGHFHPSNGTPLLRVYKATKNQPAVPAPAAINFQSALWKEDPNTVGAAAVNTTITAPGSLGAQGVLSMKGANLEPEILTEVAVPVSVFIGGNDVCGKTMYGSVITRSSGSGGTSPDLKDLAGPAIFNFFSGATATAKIKATCSLDVEFEATNFVLGDGSPLQHPICEWTFDDGTKATGCSGKVAVTAGARTATLKVKDPESSCNGTVTTAPITVSAPLSVTADLVGSCDASFTYSADVSGGSGKFSYSWSFTGAGSVSPASSSERTGTATVGPGPTTYSGSVTVTDVRKPEETGRPNGLTCTASASDRTGVFRTTAIAEIRPTCSQNVEFALTSASGLEGAPIADPTCTWTFDDGTKANGCEGIQALAAGSRSATVTVTDPSNNCSDTFTTQPLTVYPPVSVAADLVGACESFTYAAVGSGGSGNFNYSWSFDGGGSVTPSSSSIAAGSVAVDASGATYSGTVTLTDVRPDGRSCRVTASDRTGVFDTTATAAIKPTCTLDVQFELSSASGSDGTPVANPICTWTFDDGSTMTGCQGVRALAAGPHSATVKVTDPSNNCSDTITTQPITVYQPVSVVADLAPACESFTYSAVGSGGSGPLSYSWSFGGGGPIALSSSSTAAGSVAVGAGGATYSGTVTVKDVRPDGKTCEAHASDDTGVFETTATGEVKATCTLDVQFGLTSAVRSDGAPVANPTCIWTFEDGSSVTGCGGIKSLAPGPHTATLSVTDPSNNCSDTITAQPITVYQPLSVTADLVPACESFAYSAVPSGGSGGFSYSWSFSGGGAVTPSSSTDASGSVAVGAGGAAYSGTVTLTDLRPDGQTCTASASDGTGVFETTATAAIKPTCALDVEFGLTGATGSDGAPVSDPICDWTFDDGTTATGCAGTQSLPAGLHTATVKVTDPSNSCSDTITTESITVYPPLSVTADLVGTCDASFTYSAAGSGGSGAFSYLWTFAGEGSVTPSSSTAASGSVEVGPGPSAYSGTVILTDVRPDGKTCTTKASDGTNAFKTTATAALLPSCTLNVEFGAGASGLDGAPVENPTCIWTFDDGSTVTGCDGVHTLAAGPQKASVTVTDPSNNCSDTFITQPITVYQPVSVTADLVGTCAGNFTYSAVGSGGSGGSFSYLWTFSGGGSVTPSSSTTASGSVSVGAGATAYSGSVKLTDARPDGQNCPAEATDDAIVFMPIKVNLARSGTPQVCPDMTSDGLEYKALVSGGSGNYSYLWNDIACSGASCVINPADGTFCDTHTFSVSVADDSGLCPAATSERETYSKVTVVSASDN